jgi:hypothetical protein
MKNILIALDQLLNTILFGWPDETLSARSYRCYPFAAKIIDTVLWFDKKHCERSYISEQMRSQLPPEER